MYHIFIHSSVAGHLSCFHVFTIVNTAAMNIRMHISFKIINMFFSKHMSRSGIAGSYGGSIFSFLRRCLFSIGAVPICNPTNRIEGFPFLPNLSSTYCLWSDLFLSLMSSPLQGQLSKGLNQVSHLEWRLAKWVKVKLEKQGLCKSPVERCLQEDPGRWKEKQIQVGKCEIHLYSSLRWGITL